MKKRLIPTFSGTCYIANKIQSEIQMSDILENIRDIFMFRKYKNVRKLTRVQKRMKIPNI